MPCTARIISQTQLQRSLSCNEQFSSSSTRESRNGIATLATTGDGSTVITDGEPDKLPPETLDSDGVVTAANSLDITT